MYMNVPAHGREIAFEGFAGFVPLESVEAAVMQAMVRGEQLAEVLPPTCVSEGAPVLLSISSRDLALGLLNLKDDPLALADWAGFVLMMTDHLKFDRPSEPSDRLLTAVWQLAFGVPVSPGMIRLAESVVSRCTYR
ncbi:hypothetical protein [Rhizomicrobium electricum]|jgi:hypothetical protein|uniref:Uncharacterized protein n=1 Tax=Rhizomicrobium electricum TaxID=480070 RepID=A0ABN1FBU8_9PROT|nr:hypothetical protein [Rhizomicrobium electricum]NIJ50784.1 hypothetical protein [Rhizomicrobium electricum]